MRRHGVKKGLGLGLIGLAVVVLLAAGPVSRARGDDRQIEIERLRDIDNPDSAFKVDLWVNRGNATYRMGEEIIFSFRANKDCRLTLLNVSTSGKVQVLFPNEHHRDNLVKADATYRVPPEGARFRFKARGPAGEDVVKAFATLEPVALLGQEAAKPAGGIQEIPTSEKEIAIVIQDALAPINPKRWAEAEQMVKIVE